MTRNTQIRDRHRAHIARGKPPCAICGQPIDYTLKWPDLWCFVVDHIVPVIKDGADVLGNKQAAHNHCNRQKSDRLAAPIIRRSGSLT
uniref:Endonuclease n=1 Tax=Dulem virus 32 TaxID=3145750 RepID=A0AAU8B4B0_9CAUD